MERFTQEEIDWIAKCQSEPSRYSIAVDNDCVHIDDAETEVCAFSFNDYGYYFIVKLLNHIGCSADLV